MKILFIINNKEDRYKYIEEQWVFEGGSFNKNGSYILRVEWILGDVK